MPKAATKPQTKHRITLHNTACLAVHIPTNVLQSTQEFRNRLLKKSNFVLIFFSYKILVKDSLPTKAFLELFCARTNVAFATVFALTSFVCILARAVVFTGYEVSYNAILRQQKVKVQTCPLCTCSSHANVHCILCWRCLHSKCLLNLCQSCHLVFHHY